MNKPVNFFSYQDVFKERVEKNVHIFSSINIFILYYDPKKLT